MSLNAMHIVDDTAEIAANDHELSMVSIKTAPPNRINRNLLHKSSNPPKQELPRGVIGSLIAQQSIFNIDELYK